MNMQIISDNLIDSTPSSSDNNRLKQACCDFEALFINRLLKEMRKTETLSEDGGVFKSNNPFQGLFDWELSKVLGNKGSMGISEALMKQFGVNAAEQDNLRIGSGAKLDPDKGELKEIINEAAAKYGVDSSLVSAVIHCESGGNPDAVSPSGAKGLMQLLDSTGHELGVTDPFDKVQNVNAGTAYLKQMLNRFDNNLRHALAAYNAGPTAVDKYGGVPPYKETRAYVNRVLSKCGYVQEKTSNQNDIPTNWSK
jgi:Rod binding domain-containing protein